MPQHSIDFESSGCPLAQDAFVRLRDRYPHVSPEEADVIFALGGDGFVLDCLHKYMDRGLPVYGMREDRSHRLTPPYDPDHNLEERIIREQSQV